MNTTLRFQAPVIAAALVGALALTGCNRPDHDDTTAGQKLDNAVAQTEQGAEQAKDAAQNAAQRAEAAADRAGDKMANAASRMGDKANDVAVTAKVNAALAGDSKLSALKIDVDTVDGRVTLHGFAPDADSRQRATELAKAIDGVSSVDNQLQVEKK